MKSLVEALSDFTFISTPASHQMLLDRLPNMDDSNVPTRRHLGVALARDVAARSRRRAPRVISSMRRKQEHSNLNIGGFGHFHLL